MEREIPRYTCGELGISYVGSLPLSARHERVLGSSCRNRYLGRGVDGLSGRGRRIATARLSSYEQPRLGAGAPWGMGWGCWERTQELRQGLFDGRRVLARCRLTGASTSRGGARVHAMRDAGMDLKNLKEIQQTTPS
jgi:hypothetical protein